MTDDSKLGAQYSFSELEVQTSRVDFIPVSMDKIRYKIETLAQDNDLDYSPTRIRWTIRAEVEATRVDPDSGGSR